MTEGGLTSWEKSLTARYKGKPKSELYEVVIDDRLLRVYLESRQHCS